MLELKNVIGSEPSNPMKTSSNEVENHPTPFLTLHEAKANDMVSWVEIKTQNLIKLH